jgi:hypothetical protein
LVETTTNPKARRLPKSPKVTPHNHNRIIR